MRAAINNFANKISRMSETQRPTGGGAYESRFQVENREYLNSSPRNVATAAVNSFRSGKQKKTEP